LAKKKALDFSEIILDVRRKRLDVVGFQSPLCPFKQSQTLPLIRVLANLRLIVQYFAVDVSELLELQSLKFSQHGNVEGLLTSHIF
jgi:hypothetical protein